MRRDSVMWHEHVKGQSAASGDMPTLLPRLRGDVGMWLPWNSTWPRKQRHGDATQNEAPSGQDAKRRCTGTVTLASLATITLAVWATSSQARAEPAGDHTLRVVAYNVQFLPGVAGLFNERGDAPYRARQIGRKLADFDIVVLNEVFDRKPREILLGELKQAWGDACGVVVSPKPDHRIHGGCAIATRLPIVAHHAIIYSASSSVKEYGLLADGHAAKGAIHARIARSRDGKDSAFVDVFGTHLESKSGAARAVQYKELAAFVKAQSDPKHPTLIMGDLNTPGNWRHVRDATSTYNAMMDVFRSGRPHATMHDLWPTLKKTEGGTQRQTKPDAGKRIDYIIVSNPRRGRLRLEPVDVRVNHHRDAKVQALSDHSAVEAELRWVEADGR